MDRRHFLATTAGGVLAAAAVQAKPAPDVDWLSGAAAQLKAAGDSLTSFQLRAVSKLAYRRQTDAADDSQLLEGTTDVLWTTEAYKVVTDRLAGRLRCTEVCSAGMYLKYLSGGIPRPRVEYQGVVPRHKNPLQLREQYLPALGQFAIASASATSAVLKRGREELVIDLATQKPSVLRRINGKGGRTEREFAAYQVVGALEFPAVMLDKVFAGGVLVSVLSTHLESVHVNRPISLDAFSMTVPQGR